MYEKINYFMDIHEAYSEENYDSEYEPIHEAGRWAWVRKMIGLGLLPTGKAKGTRKKGAKYGAIDPKYIKDNKIDLAALKKDHPDNVTKGKLIHTLLKNNKSKDNKGKKAGDPDHKPDLIQGGSFANIHGEPAKLDKIIRKTAKKLAKERKIINKKIEVIDKDSKLLNQSMA